MSLKAAILLDIIRPARHDRGAWTEELCSARRRLARFGSTSNISRHIKGSAVPMRSIMVAPAVRATPKARLRTTGCGVPYRLSGSACVTVKRPMKRSKQVVLAGRNPSMRTNVPSWNDAAAMAKAGVDAIAALDASRCQWDAAAPVPQPRQAKAATSTRATAMWASAVATARHAIAGDVPAAADPWGARA